MSSEEILKIQEGVKYNTDNPILYKGRLTVIEQIYHQQADSDPTNLEERYSRILESEEEPYKKKLTINQDWIILNAPGLESTSLVIIRNLEGRYRTTIPDQVEIELVKERVLEVGFLVTSPHIIIPPTESARFCPSNLEKLYIRCRKGSCKISILVVPK